MEVARLFVNEELIRTVQEAETEYLKQTTIKIKDSDDIRESIL